MPHLSSRILSINGSGSDGWGVFYRARAMVAAGEMVTELTIGEHDIRTHPAILDAMHRAAQAGHTGYATIPGITALRDAVAARITRNTGIPTARENVLITPGGQSALFAAHMACCNPGETALYIEPYYATYPGTIRAAGAVPQAIATRAEDSFLPDYDRISDAALAHGAASLLVNTPNNPTGVVYPRSTLEDIAHAALDHDLWVISDEVYETQIWEGAHLSPRALPGMDQCTLVVGSMSKSHAMTGSRIGWIVAPEHVIEKLSDLATNTTYGVPGYIQDAAVFALAQGAALEEEVAAPFRRRRALAMSILEGQNVVGHIPSQGAMYLMLDIRSTGMTGEAFANALLDTHRIAVMPGESFGAAASGHIRLAMTVADDSFAVALQTLCSFAGMLIPSDFAPA
ncbi:MAG: pyridoxal phosphate-dependent aminotransferase [Rhodobacterales bacterium]